MQLVNLGFVGGGTQFFEDLGPAYSEQEGVRMVGIADLNIDLARERARTYRMSAYSSLDEMLDRKPDIDAVVIAVPNALHAPLAKKALKRGKHVQVEKPMGWDYRAAAAMDKAARTAGCLLWVSQQYTYMWDLPAAIAAAALGPIQVVTAKFMKKHGIPDRDHFFTMRTAGGGPGMDYGPHLLSVVLPALGMPQPTLASARTWKAAGVAEYGDRFEVEDRLMGSVDFGDGPRLGIDVAWAGNYEEVGVIFEGSQGALEVPLLTGQPHSPGWVPGQTAKLVVRRHDREPVTLPDQPRDVWETIQVQTANFVAAVRARDAGQVKSTASERAEQSQVLGLLGMRIIGGLYKSARSGGRQVSLTA
jgi:predicted dehydrogenase